MSPATEHTLIKGPAGTLELAIDRPKETPKGLAVIAHPHPLFGGSQDNKVVQTIARAFLSRGMICLRPNFRGVGQSQGDHDHGHGERQDLLATWLWAEETFGREAGPRRWAAGFSFGASVTTHVVSQWNAAPPIGSKPFTAITTSVVVGLAVDRVPPAAINHQTRLIHGATDDVVPLASVFDFAERYRQPVAVLPGAGHFFHGMLNELKGMVLNAVACD
jgi:alpha/beta superfamily hydrolase